MLYKLNHIVSRRSMSNKNPIGRASGGFPSTRRSAVAAARSEDPGVRQRAFERITAAYWKPVYKYIRVCWSKSNEDAEALTQAFFARLSDKDFLAWYDSARTRLRTSPPPCLGASVAHEERPSD